MSTYIPLEPQFNADQSFLGKYGLKMYGFRNMGSKSTTMSSFFRGIFWFFGHIFTYISLEMHFNAEQSFLGNHGLKMYGFQDTGGQSQWWHHHISNGCSYSSNYVSLCTVNFLLIKIFLGQQCTISITVSITSYTGPFQNKDWPWVQICIFKGFMCLWK